MPCKSQRDKGRARYMAEGGEVVRFPIGLEQADRNRMKWDRAISSVKDRYGTKLTDEAVSRYPKAKLYIGPGANK